MRDGIAQTGCHCGVDGIATVRPVQRDGGDGTGCLKLDARRVCHSSKFQGTTAQVTAHQLAGCGQRH